MSSRPCVKAEITASSGSAAPGAAAPLATKRGTTAKGLLKFVANSKQQVISTKHLGAIYDSTVAKDSSELGILCKAGMRAQFCADGWKKQACNQGEPLINFMVLKTDGGDIFLKVMRVAGVTKNAQWIADALEREALAAVGGTIRSDARLSRTCHAKDRARTAPYGMARGVVERFQNRYLCFGAQLVRVGLCAPRCAPSPPDVVELAEELVYVRGNNDTSGRSLDEEILLSI
ncbi:hypothetical protein GPECTOR_205g388 [Gonium pectorale]|uniref:Uncharacterized protein n=1 Tax=Gonium pectorale TaxID=33097 RepID=A0A150FYH6_GONPE|nr:hypothetical protein GPECTOR_205g388 [Gonium pectorale]|eukprot:KXZ42100.1 hypothetical protein GPECTOR_205g388 [Gonium pectorale]